MVGLFRARGVGEPAQTFQTKSRDLGELSTPKRLPALCIWYFFVLARFLSETKGGFTAVWLE